MFTYLTLYVYICIRVAVYLSFNERKFLYPPALRGLKSISFLLDICREPSICLSMFQPGKQDDETLNTVLSQVMPFECTHESVWNSSTSCKKFPLNRSQNWRDSSAEYLKVSLRCICLCQYRTPYGIEGRATGEEIWKESVVSQLRYNPLYWHGRAEENHGRHQSVIYSFMTPKNEYLRHKNIVIYCCYTYRRYIRHIQGVLHWNLKFTDM